MKRLRISDNCHFLVWDDGTPFFWLGDTVWELFHRANLDEAELYLENRRQKGFNVVQAVLLAEFDGLNTPNVLGDCPLIDNDPLRPNEAYFQHVDRIIAIAAAKEIMVGLLPTWGDKLELLAHGKGPIVFDAANAFAYGQWLGRRYSEIWNLIWINGGDRPGGGTNQLIWDALGRGIKSKDANHLMTFHPPGGGDGRSSSEWFHHADWLDFNLAQSGHARKHLPNYEIVSHDYQLTPSKPCLDGEPRYEDHAVNWKPVDLGWFDDYDVRQAAYWAVFSGAFGHTYGAHPMWQMCGDRYEPITFARRNWIQAMDLPGAHQMTHVRRLIESRPMLSRVPDQTILTAAKTGGAHCRACRGDEYLFVYLPQGGEVTINPATIQDEQVRAWWFDLRAGAARELGLLPKETTMTFTTPWAGPCSDWVLVMDGARKNYPAPGGW